MFELWAPAQEVVEGSWPNFFGLPRKSQRTKKTCDSGTQLSDLCDIHLDYYKYDNWDEFDYWRVAELVTFLRQICMRIN